MSYLTLKIACRILVQYEVKFLVKSTKLSDFHLTNQNIMLNIYNCVYLHNFDIGRIFVTDRYALPYPKKHFIIHIYGKRDGFISIEIRVLYFTNGIINYYTVNYLMIHVDCVNCKI